jgi:tetratricopeptide (TPR) repeat protein
VANLQGDYARAAALIEEALVLCQALGDTVGIANSIANLGWVAFWQGDHGRAVALLDEAVARRRALGDKAGIATSLNDLGLVAHAQGDYVRAAALVQKGLLLSHTTGAKRLMAEGLENTALVATARGQSELATQFAGAAEALREAVGMPLGPEQRAGHDQALQAMRAALGVEAFAAAWAEGRALSLDEAVALALGHAQSAARQAD